jgi:hypothetical protein
MSPRLIDLRSRLGSWRRKFDRDCGAGVEQVWLAADGDLQRSALVKEVALLVVGELHPDLPVAESKREREFGPVAR